MRYPVPALDAGAWFEAEIEVERSRFIAWLAHAPDIAAFDALLAEARRRHPNASHHCSAFIAGAPGEQTAIGFSDDGEPGGTAGRPMFQALTGDGIGQVGAVVTRYFGGTKLGTGGLARAYAQAVIAALGDVPRREITERHRVSVSLEFAGEAEARDWCQHHDVLIEGADYSADGVTLTLGWPSDMAVDVSELSSRLRGRLSLDERD
ncbi:IMPACT family protein [Halomonas sp. V046]|uniref:IMPACT family protein n=1 Tax=Halomonas sp. V046 TaxID=3459611 RepID=UPI00404517B5